MRMDPNLAVTAADIVNTAGARELARIIRDYGEERWASRIARFIVDRRSKAGPITTTGQLVSVILAAVPAAGGGAAPGAKDLSGASDSRQ